jgi:hypothetical protein
MSDTVEPPSLLWPLMNRFCFFNSKELEVLFRARHLVGVLKQICDLIGEKFWDLRSQIRRLRSEAICSCQISLNRRVNGPSLCFEHKDRTLHRPSSLSGDFLRQILSTALTSNLLHAVRISTVVSTTQVCGQSTKSLPLSSVFGRSFIDRIWQMSVLNLVDCFKHCQE